MNELKRTREALNNAIAYVEAGGLPARTSGAGKTIRVGEGRAIAILTALRDAGGRLTQREFEDSCLRNCRTLVGAGGFIARGSIVKSTPDTGDAEYILTDKGLETVAKWESRYGVKWRSSLEHPDALNNSDFNDQQKTRLLIS